MGSSRHKLTPELEHDLLRDPRWGYEPATPHEFVRCFEHGSPTPLERWHCHEEYELQLIVGTHGRAFVGDYIGNFEPGHLVLTGPGLPHNWVSAALPPDGLAVRSLVIQFHEAPLRDAMRPLRALESLETLLTQARQGLEFFGISEAVKGHFYGIKASHGMDRLVAFLSLLNCLRGCQDTRLLSSEQVTGSALTDASSPLNTIMHFIQDNYATPISVTQMAALVNMSESRFSRYFSHATQSTFTAFVNRLRIHKACELLMHSERPISTICYDVGFNNLANFNRRFLEIKNMTPREFRRQAIERLGLDLSRRTHFSTGAH